MSQGINRSILLAKRPVGAPEGSDFELSEAPIADPGEGEVGLRTIYLSLDPYMRGRMSAAKSYAPSVEIGETMVGGAVSEVMTSNAEGYSSGDIVVGYTGWHDHPVVPARDLRKLDAARAPISTALGVLGMPGMTAYTGLLNIGKPKEGETVAVAAATGAVGSIVGQIAKIMGCRVVGIAGSAEKCDYLTAELGFDAAVNHRADGFTAALAGACPDGIDVYFENVGGHVFQAVLPLLNEFARIPVCGLIAHYNAIEPPSGPDHLPVLMGHVLRRRFTVRGFIVWDFADQEQEFLDAVGGWLGDGRIKYREDFVDGLENAPDALIGLLEGKNFGKLVVRVGPEPTA
jgi:NADPH-dependent curcumin reductase CurA